MGMVGQNAPMNDFTCNTFTVTLWDIHYVCKQVCRKYVERLFLDVVDAKCWTLSVCRVNRREGGKEGGREGGREGYRNESC